MYGLQTTKKNAQEEQIVNPIKVKHTGGCAGGVYSQYKFYKRNDFQASVKMCAVQCTDQNNLKL